MQRPVGAQGHAAQPAVEVVDHRLLAAKGYAGVQVPDRLLGLARGRKHRRHVEAHSHEDELLRLEPARDQAPRIDRPVNRAGGDDRVGEGIKVQFGVLDEDAPGRVERRLPKPDVGSGLREAVLEGVKEEGGHLKPVRRRDIQLERQQEAQHEPRSPEREGQDAVGAQAHAR